MTCKQKIEAQIAELQHEGWYATDNTEAGPVAATLQALLDVAVAADQLLNELAHYGHESADSMNAMSAALDKLREVMDERL